MEYEIGGKYFSSKQAIVKHTQQILKDATPGEVLQGDNRAFLIGLIECHPRAKDKIGVGIKHIIARVDPVWKKSKQFLIIRYDGSNIDFSYKKCLYGEISPLEYFRSACRTAIAPDIISFKIVYLTPAATCPYFGEPLTKDNAHVDHVKPRVFNWIVDQFMEIEGISLGKCEVVGDVQKRFLDKSVNDKFRRFHNVVAQLELVSERANQTCCKVNFKGECR
jgi:hypothetical protein